MGNNQIEAIDEMLKKQKSEELLIESFGMFFGINRENAISRIVIIALSLVLSAIISIGNTVTIMHELSLVMLDVAIAIFGIIFTGYAIFQALLNGQLVSLLMQDIKVNEKTKRSQCTLHETNWNFVQLMMQFVVMMFVNLLLKISLTAISEDFCLFSNMVINEIIVFTFIFVYFYHAIVILWRMVSFVFNIYQLFNSYAVSEFLEFIRHKDDNM